MTPAEIEALCALCGAATPGPWVVEHGYVRQANGHDIPKTDADVAFAAAARAGLPAALAALVEARDEVERFAMVRAEWANSTARLMEQVKAAEARAAELQAEAALWQRRCAELDTKASDERARLRAERDALFTAMVGLVEWGARGHNPNDIAPWIRASQVLKDARALAVATHGEGKG